MKNFKLTKSIQNIYMIIKWDFNIRARTTDLFEYVRHLKGKHRIYITLIQYGEFPIQIEEEPAKHLSGLDNLDSVWSGSIIFI